MDSGFLLTEVYSENVYCKYTPHRITQCLSVSEEGYVAIVEKSSCRVLHPYLNKIYLIPNDYPLNWDEDQDRKGKSKRKVQYDDEIEGEIGGEYCLVQWAPSSLGFNGSSFLLTVKYVPEIILWGIPFASSSTNMHEIVNLTTLITSTGLYQSCCFAKSEHQLVLSINNVIFVFGLKWIKDSKPTLCVCLEYAVECEEDIVCICDGELVLDVDTVSLFGNGVQGDASGLLDGNLLDVNNIQGSVLDGGLSRGNLLDVHTNLQENQLNFQDNLSQLNLQDHVSQLNFQEHPNQVNPQDSHSQLNPLNNTTLINPQEHPNQLNPLNNSTLINPQEHPNQLKPPSTQTNLHLLCGTVRGQIRCVSLPTFSIESTNEDEYTPGQQTESILYFVHCRFHCREIKSTDSVIVSTLLSQPYPYQGSIMSIQSYDQGYLVSDGVHLTLFDPTSWKLRWRITVNEGCVACQFCSDSLFYITTTYQLVTMNPLTQTVLRSQSLLPSVNHYCDFAMIGSIPIPFGSQPAFLVLYYCLSGIRTTTIDYRYQKLSLQSAWYPIPETTWTPNLILTPSELDITTIAIDSILNGKYSFDDLWKMHISICYRLRCKKSSIQDLNHAATILLAIQRKRIEIFREHRTDALSKWIVYKLGLGELPTVEKRECECCKLKVVLNEGHAEWCCLGHIDQYCWYSLKPILTNDIFICPCCLHSYLDGEVCLFCNLRLVYTHGRPKNSLVFGRETIQKQKSVISEWNCVSIVWFKQKRECTCPLFN